ncbi:MAG: cysteine--tRNA ligase [Candidatus Peregrinibacteria bacterium]
MSKASVSSLRLYNTLTKKEEEFVSIEENRRTTLRLAPHSRSGLAQGENGSRGTVFMYTCGPTVYGRPHIGNYSSFLMADLLRRWLEVSGYRVKHVKNITDVGHLLHDADTGDDKVQKQAERENIHPLEIARRYTNEFLDDEKALNMLPLDEEHRPRASGYVKQMLAMVKTLLRKGNAYETADGIYFSVSSFPQYGALSGNTLENLSVGARIEVKEEKRHPADFALWKKCVCGNAAHILRWSYATGEVSHGEGEDPDSGFPGWHIECSAMSSALLGEQIDIHTGGEDNIFPHHECEIAQSEAASGLCPFSCFWIHRRRISIGREKMSKSLGNVYTVPDIGEKGFSPLDLRYYLLSVHYRTNLKFTWKGLSDAHSARCSITEWMDRGGGGEFAPFIGEGMELPKTTAKDIDQCKQKFIDSMNSDLNTPSALSAVFECMHAMNRSVNPDTAAKKVLESFIEIIRNTFGCFDPEEVEQIPDDVQKLITEREQARSAKNFAEADRLRDAISKMGFVVRDTAKGQEVRRR